MAEFQEIMRIHKRMCQSYKVCAECCIYKIPNVSCKTYIYKYPEDAEKLLLKWAEEHPIKTNAEKFKEMFGIKTTLEGCFGIPCVHHDADCPTCEYQHFWEREYKEK